jgi:hypothetical protein
MVEATKTFTNDSETLAANDISVRTNLAFRIADAAIQTMLPTGWKSSPSISGTDQGTPTP